MVALVMERCMHKDDTMSIGDVADEREISFPIARISLHPYPRVTSSDASFSCASQGTSSGSYCMQ